MPTFDIVSEVNMQEVDNAVNQTLKEIGQRYDFRGSKSKLTQDKETILLLADDEFKGNAILDILRQKCAKREVDLKALDIGAFEPAAGGMVKMEIKLKQGIETSAAKKIVKHIKELGLKVQPQIRDQQVRVSGKKRDDLQAVMTALRALDFDLPLQFINFRD